MATLLALARECVPSPSLVRARVRDASDDTAADALARSSDIDDACFASKLSALRDALGQHNRPPCRRRDDDAPEPPKRMVEEIIDDDARDANEDDDDGWTHAFLAVATHARADAAEGVPEWSSAAASTIAASIGDEYFNMSNELTQGFVLAALTAMFHALETPKDSLKMGGDDADARALVSARQLHWLVSSIVSSPFNDNDECDDVRRRIVPCVLRAMDYPSHAVKMYGARCAARLSSASAASRRDDDYVAPLLDASRSALIGATPDIWPYALESACNFTVKRNGQEKEYRLTFTRILDAASLHAMDVKYAAPALKTLPSFIENANLYVVPHLARIFSLFGAYLQSYNDDVSIGAANAMRVAAERAWPRVAARCATTWPELKRAYAEADGRAAKKCDELRRAIERVGEVLQLAAGEQFTSIWSADPNVPEHAADFVAFLKSLPSKKISSHA